MTRILHLRSSCGLYGADRALLDLCEGLSQRDLQPIVGSIVRTGVEDLLGQEAIRRGLRTMRLDSTGRVDLAAARALVQRLESQRIGLIHAHDYKSLSLAIVATRLNGIPVVATYHGDTAATPALRAYEALARVLGNATRGVTAVSAPLAKKLGRWIHTAPIHHIPNGIRAGAPCSESERTAARSTFGIPSDAQVIASVGRLSVEKGHAVLLEAMRRLRRPPVLLLAGEGPLQESLGERATGLDVRWLGFVAEPRPVYAAADAVVLPSLTEGLPLVALEAMALARPLVATQVGELPTLLCDGAGALCRSNDAGDLARVLQQVLDLPVHRSEMAARARRRVLEQYTLERTAERHLRELYAPVLGARNETEPHRPAGWAGARAG